jgi:hypothetical protein
MTEVDLAGIIGFIAGAFVMKVVCLVIYLLI